MVLGLAELGLSAEQCLVILKQGVNVGRAQLSGRGFSSVRRTLGTNPSTAPIKREELGGVVHTATQHSGGRG